jgi:hypothetical protein
MEISNEENYFYPLGVNYSDSTLYPDLDVFPLKQSFYIYPSENLYSYKTNYTREETYPDIDLFPQVGSD